jgi:hypothetical protein
MPEHERDPIFIHDYLELFTARVECFEIRKVLGKSAPFKHEYIPDMAHKAKNTSCAFRATKISASLLRCNLLGQILRSLSYRMSQIINPINSMFLLEARSSFAVTQLLPLCKPPCDITR